MTGPVTGSYTLIFLYALRQPDENSLMTVVIDLSHLITLLHLSEP